jgi:hypothetical protein
MTLQRLRALLDSYGSRPECWPEDERDAALAAVAASAEARQLCERAARLDTALDSLTVPPVSAALAARILADARKED